MNEEKAVPALWRERPFVVLHDSLQKAERSGGNAGNSNVNCKRY